MAGHIVGSDTSLEVILGHFPGLLVQGTSHLNLSSELCLRAFDAKLYNQVIHSLFYSKGSDQAAYRQIA
jgi:hypothetical protein